MATLTKNPLFAMLDTETVYLKKRVYELALIIFDSVTCEVITSKKWYIKETLEGAVYYQLRHSKPPIFWPSRLNALSLLKDAVAWQDAIAEFLTLLEINGVSSLIAHNVNFDINAIYATENKIRGMNAGGPFLANYEKLELSGFFVHGLPLMAAYNVPYKLKSGCMTFKADYLVPCFTNGTQNHDALGDCYNQLELYKLTKGKYQNQGTIYHNMLAHHRLKHAGNKRLGSDSLE